MTILFELIFRASRRCPRNCRSLQGTPHGRPGQAGQVGFARGLWLFYLPCSLRPESSQEHLPTSIAGVLRLRAIKPSVCDRSAKRFAQDDDFVWGLAKQLVGYAETRKIEKVTGSLNEQTPDSAMGRAGSQELRLVCASDVDDGGCIFVPPWQRRSRHKQCGWRLGDTRCGPVCGPQR